MSGYPTLDAARKNTRIEWYRTKIDRSVLTAMTRRSDMKGMIQALGHLLIYSISAASAIYLWSRQLWIGLVLTLWIHGMVTSFFHGTATHELSHKTVFRTKRFNEVFLYLFSLLGWWNPVDYQASHRHHHLYTLYPAVDRENVLPLPPVPGIFTIFQLFTVNLFTLPGRNFGSGGFLATVGHHLADAFGLPFPSKSPASEWLTALHKDDPCVSRKSAWWSRLLLMFHGTIILIGIRSGIWVVPLVFTFAPFIANAVSYSLGITQHSGMMENEPDYRKVARSMKLGPILEFLYWRMNWHCEHHMYAAVPCYNLRKLSKHIEYDLPVPKGFFGTWKEMLEIRRREKEDPSPQRFTVT